MTGSLICITQLNNPHTPGDYALYRAVVQNTVFQSRSQLSSVTEVKERLGAVEEQNTLDSALGFGWTIDWKRN